MRVTGITVSTLFKSYFVTSSQNLQIFTVPNKAEVKAYRAAYRLTVEGRLRKTYEGMSRRVRGKAKGNEHIYGGLSICSRKEFMQWASNDTNFLRLFNAWLESGCEYSISPSIDRIDNERGYDLDNIQWLTVSENSVKRGEDNAKKL